MFFSSSETLSGEWQGPYTDPNSRKQYYHHLQSDKTVWEDPFSSANYCAEMCIKLLGQYGTKSDINEANENFQRRREVLRKHRQAMNDDL